MVDYKIGISLLCLSFFVSAAYGIDCKEQPNGSYETSCKTYVECTDGTGKEIECTGGQLFNSETGKCDDPANVGPPCNVTVDCSAEKDGRYPDFDNDCKSYYTCDGGLFLGHNFCPPDLVFHPETGNCDYKFSVPPPCGSAFDDKQN